MIIVSVYELDPCRNYGVAEHNLVETLLLLYGPLYISISRICQTLKIRRLTTGVWDTLHLLA
jgi:hypothetical protein